jgi:hypothetical protein
MVEREELPVFELRRSRIDRRDRHPLDLNRGVAILGFPPGIGVLRRVSSVRERYD